MSVDAARVQSVRLFRILAIANSYQWRLMYSKLLAPDGSILDQNRFPFHIFHDFHDSIALEFHRESVCQLAEHYVVVQ